MYLDGLKDSTLRWALFAVVIFAGIGLFSVVSAVLFAVSVQLETVAC